MFSDKDYHCVCHGCGHLHTVRCSFMSSPTSFMFDSLDGGKTRWSLPMRGCDACLAIKTERREDHPVARAYDRGMTPEARAIAQAEFPAWLPKIEASRLASR